jgi:hypothetical protein
MNASFKRMWSRPILIGIITGVGLISALLGDDAWDYLSACALAVPVVASFWYSFRKQ